MFLTHCAMCGAAVGQLTKPLRDAARRRGGWVYCSKPCSDRYRSWVSSMTAANTNRKHASERMRKRNPMQREEVRAKVSTTLRAMGWKPAKRGGNGTGPTAAQMLLASMLGWEMEIVVKTGYSSGSGSGYPPCYKLDVGCLPLRIGVEIDGQSHCALDRKQQDQKKDSLLQSLGWKVLRFSNKEVIADPTKVVQTVLSTISKLPNTTITSLKES